MNNNELYKQWIERHFERERKEAEEAKRKQKKENKPTKAQKLPEFKQAFFLQDDFGKSIHEKIQEKYGSFHAISIINYDEKGKIVKGTNPFYVLAANEFLPEGIRTATQADLERILKTNLLNLKNIWEDSSLVWRSNQDPNEYLAKALYQQFKDRGITLQEGTPYVIPLFTLKLRQDTKSEHKLAFDISNSTLESYFEAPILNEVYQQQFNNSDIDEKTGIPSQVGNSGNRKLYTRNYQDDTPKNSGLSRLDLDLGPDLDSCWDDLASSLEDGRVVLVSSEAGAKNFSAKAHRKISK